MDNTESFGTKYTYKIFKLRKGKKMKLPSKFMTIAVRAAHFLSKLRGVSYLSASSITMKIAWLIFKIKK